MELNTTMTEKVVIAAVPYVETLRPLAAPAVLKAALIKHNIDAIGIDLNAEIVNQVNNHPQKDSFIEFFYRRKNKFDVTSELSSMINYCADQILAHNPTIVGLSLFCLSCQVFCSWLCAAIKQRNPDVKIVIGGPGLQVLSGAMTFNFPDHLKRRNLIDDYIIGDAEESFVEYVKGNLNYPGINSNTWKPISSLDEQETPNYKDYKWMYYKEPTLPIVDSRGCVQSCEFCDVIAFWKKFQYASAEHIFDQMIQLMKEYKLTRFDFRSSIANGNLKEFRNLIKLIGDYNDREDLYPTEKISWNGSFIIRKITTHDEKFWQDLKRSNPDGLFVGVESVVEHVRIGLGKNFTNDDLDYFLKMTQQYQIPISLLMIAGYPTETVDDYKFVEQWWKDRSNLDNVVSVQLSETGFLPGAEINQTTDITKFRTGEPVRRVHINNLIDIIQNKCRYKLYLPSEFKYEL